MFRPEAMNHRRQRLEGEVTLTRSLPLSVTIGLLTAITIFIATWAIMGHYSRTETVTGSLTPEGVLSKVYADKPGQLRWLGVKDGDIVRQGQPIATISTEQALEGGASPDDQRLFSVAEQSQLTNRELGYEDDRANKERVRLTRQIRDLGAERAQMSSQIDLQKQAVTSTRTSFDAMTALVDKGFESRTQYEQRRQTWLAAATQLQALVQQIAQIDERRSEAESSLAKLPSDHANKIADLHNSLDTLVQHRIDIEGARSFTITAPISGRVTAVQAMAGRSTDGRLPLLAIVPQGAAMQATLYAPSRAIGMARIGQPVRLMYDAFPYQRFGSFTGHIVRISHSVLAPNEVDTPVKLDEPVYEVGVALDNQKINAFGEELPLEPGMTLTADVILDKRSFLDWVLEPIRAIRERS
ncbi:HlyD family efflux transporter periplasmic adaptor subunit [Sphingomonas sp. QA11]|uniref:HlyD family secretion protein n=1 Tax=Sphingomonas sp. QA11 TaxID=2950605 RepID=UPI002349FD55|nr:HlyD family efflux transporter periplasmic adaptor subunit [Sphingomonas sp. QA11]WCM25916.1 HlyD family efflux transporter periplasmic adaptor subunit [Sphingomonas sp. QA11]